MFSRNLTTTPRRTFLTQNSSRKSAMQPKPTLEPMNSITSLQVRVCKYVVIMDDSIAVCSYDRSSLVPMLASAAWLIFVRSFVLGMFVLE